MPDILAMLTHERDKLLLATALGPLRQFVLAHPGIYGFGQGFWACPYKGMNRGRSGGNVEIPP
jgi:hypothetical protein